MIRTSEKSPEALDRNKRKTLQRRWATLRFLIEPCLRFFEGLQARSHEIFVKRVSEERTAFHESHSMAAIARRPGISEESLALARQMEKIPIRDKPILIVDDEKNIRLTLSQSLEVLGVETDTAEDGKEALVKLREKEFGVILLDIRMPGVDGMEVLRQVRESKPDIRIIIITAYGTIELAVEAMKLGAADFIPKPFVPEEIREVVARVLDREKTGQIKRNPPHLFN
jgi:CheY-like chemotaxis protein